MTVPGSIRAIAVVIPARDEEELLPAALMSLRTAAAHPGIESVRVLTVVVADCCTDTTAAVSRAAGALVVPVHFRNVGRARAAGVRAALGVIGGPRTACGSLPPTPIAQYGRTGSRTRRLAPQKAGTLSSAP